MNLKKQLQGLQIRNWHLGCVQGAGRVQHALALAVGEVHECNRSERHGSPAGAEGSFPNKHRVGVRVRICYNCCSGFYNL